MANTRSEFRPPTPDALQAHLSRLPQGGNQSVDHFAVLIGAHTELRHRGNLSMAYQVLLEQGYQRDKIFILDSEGATPFFPLTDVTTRASVRALFSYLAQVVEAEDSLLVYVTGHGRRIKAEEESNGSRRTLGVSTLMLNLAEEMTQDEFQGYLEAIQPEVGIVFFDQCYWGPLFSNKMCNYVTITTATEQETSHGVSFPRAFWEAFRTAPRGHAPSLLKAFKHAMVQDRATRKGFNRPRISHGCVHPDDVVLLGARRQSGGADVQTAIMGQR